MRSLPRRLCFWGSCAPIERAVAEYYTSLADVAATEQEEWGHFAERELSSR